MVPFHGGRAAGSDVATPFEYRVLGWSGDGRLWGFQEKGEYGGGMTFSPGGGVYVIDAAKNSFVFRHFRDVGESDDQGVEWARHTASEWEREDREGAREWGLEGGLGTLVYQKPKMVWVDYDSQFKQFGERLVTFAHGGARYELRLTPSFVSAPNTMAGTRSKFSLALRKDEGEWRVLQEDKRHWRPYLAYGIVYVSISPDAKAIAVLIEAIENGVEGQKQAFYKGVAGPLQ
jgi:hypothetical protein